MTHTDEGFAKCQHGAAYMRPTQAEAERLAENCETEGGCGDQDGRDFAPEGTGSWWWASADEALCPSCRDPGWSTGTHASRYLPQAAADLGLVCDECGTMARGDGQTKSPTAADLLEALVNLEAACEQEVPSHILEGALLPAMRKARRAIAQAKGAT